MKQIEDDKTLEIALEQKKGRGRPRKADALTGAERMRRFRLAHPKAEQAAPPPPGADMVPRKEFDELARIEAKRAFDLAVAHAENRQLLAKIVEQAAEIAELKKKRGGSSPPPKKAT